MEERKTVRRFEEIVTKPMEPRRLRESEKMKRLIMRQVQVAIPEGQALEELKEGLGRMGCLGFLEKPWRLIDLSVVQDLVTHQVEECFAHTLRG